MDNTAITHALKLIQHIISFTEQITALCLGTEAALQPFAWGPFYTEKITTGSTKMRKKNTL